MNKFKLFLIFILSLVLIHGTDSSFAQTYLEKIGKTLHHPWGMDFLSDTELLVSERRGTLHKVNLITGQSVEIAGLPKVFSKGQGGLLDVVVNKKSSTNDQIIYFCYNFLEANNVGTAIVQGTLTNNIIFNQVILIKSNHVSYSFKHFGCRLLLQDNKLFATFGDRGDRNTAQDISNHSGSVIRINLKSNKNSNTTEKVKLYSIGHRNPQGIALNPRTNEIWSHEHGPKGGDEINIIKEGKNYGWPIVTLGEEYFGGKIGLGSSSPNHESPIWSWTPSIAPSGMAFYDKGMFNEFKGHLLIGSLKFRALYLVKLKDNRPTSENIILKNKIGRIRDVAVTNDGSILLLTDEREGGLYRLFR